VGLKYKEITRNSMIRKITIVAIETDLRVLRNQNKEQTVRIQACLEPIAKIQACATNQP